MSVGNHIFCKNSSLIYWKRDTKAPEKTPRCHGIIMRKGKILQIPTKFRLPHIFSGHRISDFRLMFIVYFSPRILGLFSQTSGDQYFHWMNPSYTIDTTFPGGSLEIFLLQHHSSKESILLCSDFLIVYLSHPYVTTGKTIALTRQTFVDKVSAF